MLYDISVRDSDGQDISLNDYKGKVLLIINSATGCGLTPQYSGIQKLYDDYKDKGFEVLDFPCNQFANQAPGEIDEIKTFCESRFGVTFKVFDKIDVNGEHADPLFKFLKEEKSGLLGAKIKWNFTKFLVDQEGKVVKRFGPNVEPEKIAKDIEKLL